MKKLCRLYSCSRWRDKVKGPRTKRCFNKISDLDLYDKVKSDILYYAKTQGDSYLHFTAESYANEFKVPVHRVTRVFRMLNREGLLSQRHNRKTDFRWNASFYYLIRENLSRFI